MRRIATLFLILVCVTNGDLFGQTYNAFVKAGDLAVAQKEPYDAYFYYGKAIEKEHKDLELLQKYASACEAVFDYQTAIKWYEKINVQKPATLEIQLKLISLYKVTGEYQKAKLLLGKLKKKNRKNEELLSVLKDEEEGCLIGEKKFAEEVLPSRVKSGNTKFSEVSPYYNNGVLTYSTFKEGEIDEMIGGILETDFERLLNRVQWLKGEPYIYANPTLSSDQKYWVYNRCEKTDDFEISCEILVATTKKGIGSEMQLKLGEEVNQNGSSNSQPFLKFRENSNDYILLFSSNRDNGQGGFDLYKAILSDSLETKSLENLGPEINSEQDEFSPFLFEDTLFFSSDGHPGMGGFDVFKVDFENRHRPINLGGKYNSGYHDLFFRPFLENDVAYFSSNRPGSIPWERGTACCFDIYQTPWKKSIPEEIIPPIVTEAPPVIPEVIQPPKLITPVKPDFFSTTVYFANDEPDPDSRMEKSSTDYDYSYYSFLDQRSIYAENQTKEEINAFNKYFKQLVEGRNDLISRLYEVERLLKEGKKVSLTLKGSASPRFQSEYNMNLSKRRVDSVEQTILSYKNGVLNAFIETGNLLISKSFFGELNANKIVPDEDKESKASIFSVAAGLERKVVIEFLIQ